MIEKTEYTKGPWEVSYLDRNGQAVVKAEHIEIATCWHHGVGAIEKEMHANAQLIAAAPELLEALQRIVEIEQDNKVEFIQHDVISIAEDAIAKAKEIKKWKKKLKMVKK